MKGSVSQYAIPIAISSVMIGFGINQVIHSKKWNEYVPKIISDIVPVEDTVIIKMHGAGNLSLGILYVLFHKNALIRWIVAAWWFNLILLCGRHDWREGLRDAPIFIASSLYAYRKT